MQLWPAEKRALSTKLVRRPQSFSTFCRWVRWIPVRRGNVLLYAEGRLASSQFFRWDYRYSIKTQSMRYMSILPSNVCTLFQHIIQIYGFFAMRSCTSTMQQHSLTLLLIIPWTRLRALFPRKKTAATLFHYFTLTHPRCSSRWQHHDWSDFLIKENKINPIYSAGEKGNPKGAKHCEISYKLLISAEGRNLRYQALLPAELAGSRDGKVLETGQASIAAAFRPGTIWLWCLNNIYH